MRHSSPLHHTTANPFRLVPLPYRRALFFLALASITFVSLWSGANIEEHVSESIQRNGGGIHFLCYSTLAAVALWAYGRTHTPWQSRGITLTFCILFGITMELMQMLPWVGRCCSLADIRDNSLGALLSVLLFPVAWWPQGK